MRHQQIYTCLQLAFIVMAHSTYIVAADDKGTKNCADFVSEPDALIGVSAVEDVTCAEESQDTLGCFSNICRFCLSPEATDAAPDFVPCSEILVGESSDASTEQWPEPGDSCTMLVSEEDKANSISAVHDENCFARGGLGCMTYSEKNMACRLCKLEDTAEGLNLEKCEHDEVPSISSSTGGSVQHDDYTCPELVTVGDANAGISAYYDQDCLNEGGIGCFPPSDGHACRFCKTEISEKSKNFLPCDGRFDSSYSMDSDECAASVSYAEIRVGISAIIDEECENGGYGCFLHEGDAGEDDVHCRFCRFQKTDESRHLTSCTDEGNSDDKVSNCGDEVSLGDVAVGISAYPDQICANGGNGCFYESQCRYCRNGSKNEKNKHFADCPSECQSYVDKSSYTDVSYTTDDRCTGDMARDLPGCQQGTECRLCMTRKNVGNAALLYCSVQKALREADDEKNVGGKISVAKTESNGPSSGSDTDNYAYWMLGCVVLLAIILSILIIVMVQKRRRSEEEDICQSPWFINKLDTSQIVRL